MRDHNICFWTNTKDYTLVIPVTPSYLECCFQNIYGIYSKHVALQTCGFYLFLLCMFR